MHDDAGTAKSIAGLPHILVVDDDDRIRTLVTRYLNENGFAAFMAGNAAEAGDILKVALFDAIVLDVMMPGEDGRSFTQKLRADNDTPVLLLTAMGEADDRIAGFQSGADDYLTKPFDPRELVLRLQAILRRRPAQSPAASKIYSIGKWLYDPVLPELKADNENIRLTDVENNLLQALLRNIGAVSSREELAEACGIDAGERTIDVQVTRLRRKLEEDSKLPRHLLTLRGKGYLLRAEEISS